MAKRPDMFAKLKLTDKEDIALMEEIKKDATRKKLTEEFSLQARTAGRYGGHPAHHGRRPPQS